MRRSAAGARSTQKARVDAAKGGAVPRGNGKGKNLDVTSMQRRTARPYPVVVLKPQPTKHKKFIFFIFLGGWWKVTPGFCKISQHFMECFKETPPNSAPGQGIGCIYFGETCFRSRRAEHRHPADGRCASQRTWARPAGTWRRSERPPPGWPTCSLGLQLLHLGLKGVGKAAGDRLLAAQDQLAELGADGSGGSCRNRRGPGP